jgi:hypothetical protein
MPAHSLAAARGVRTQTSIENSHRHERPRSMNCGTRVSTRCRCPTSVPAARCSSHSGWARPGPSKAIRKRSPRRVRLPATEPRQLLRTRTWCCCSSSPHFRCCLLGRIDDVVEKNCCQSSIRLGTGRISVRNPRSHRAARPNLPRMGYDPRRPVQPSRVLVNSLATGPFQPIALPGPQYR